MPIYDMPLFYKFRYFNQLITLVNYFKSKKYLWLIFPAEEFLCILQMKNDTFSSISLKNFAPFP